MKGGSEKTCTIGVDEMGRGPLAGPLYVCACGVFDLKKLPKPTKTCPVRDSKKLSEKQREEWWKILNEKRKDGELFIEYSAITPKIIDSKGISYSTRCGATEAVMKVLKKAHITSGMIRIVLDGNLYVDKEKLEAFFPKCVFYTKTIIKGDETVKIISFASIYGKVMRDRYMVTQDKKYPQYGLKRHKGYGTRGHIEALKKYGPSKFHRISFLDNFVF
ncbi:ribonuclease HII [Candidatus Parcubacteria bacterium]|jgi:ribonuclease HII|nr:MAG: ribonuclease HII [Candidatus Parcubacteria bacterium]